MTREEAIETIKDICLTTEQLTRIEKALECLLSQPSLPSNLDEAAEDFAKRHIKLAPFARKFFKAGAEWMAGQGANADFGVCKLANRAWLTPIDEKRFAQDIFDNFGAGDKVVVQIRKK